MRFILRKRTSHDIPFGFIYGTIALALIAASRAMQTGDLLPSCAFRVVTGIPCPTCGTTRLLAMLAHGDVAGAFTMNPAIALGITGAIVLLTHDAAFLHTNSRISINVTRRESHWLRIGATSALLANWFYLIASH